MSKTTSNSTSQVASTAIPYDESQVIYVLESAPKVDDQGKESIHLEIQDGESFDRIHDFARRVRRYAKKNASKLIDSADSSGNSIVDRLSKEVFIDRTINRILKQAAIDIFGKPQCIAQCECDRTNSRVLLVNATKWKRELGEVPSRAEVVAAFSRVVSVAGNPGK